MKRFVPSRSTVAGFILSTIALFQCSDSFAQPWYLDSDNDGWGDLSNPNMSMSKPAGYVRNSLDCDDGIANGITWNVVDSRGFSSGQVLYTSLAIDPAGVPHLAYKDLANGNKASVMILNAGTWSPLGSAGFSAGAADYVSLAIDASGTPYVAYRDGAAANKVTVKQFDGTNWVTVGTSGFSAAQASHVSLAINSSGTPYVAFRDAANTNFATVMMFNGTSWVTVGSAGFSAGAADNISLAIDGSGTPYIAYRDASSANAATVMMFDGANWVAVGTPGLSAGQATYLSLAINNSGTPYLAYRDAFNGNKTTVMMFDGTNWVTVGAAGFSPAAASFLSLAIDPDDTPYLGFNTSTKAMVMKFNGTSWVPTGSSGASPGIADYNSLAIDENTGIPYLAFRDRANNNAATVTMMAPDSLLPSVSIVSDAVANSICNGTTVTFTATPVNGGTSPIYQWKKNRVNVGTNSNIYTDASISNNDSITVEIVSNAPCFAVTPVASNLIRMTVKPIPVISAVTDLVRCNGVTTGNINFSSTVSGTTYAWTNDNTSIGLAANGTGRINSFIATNATNAPIFGTISVTPTAAGCAGTPEDFTITVNPTPTVNAITNQAVCNGDMSSLVSFTGAVGSTTYTWTNNNISIGLAAGGTGDIAAFTATNATTSAVTATITVVPSANGCTGTSRTFTIRVNPTPTVNAVSDLVRCNGASTGAISFTGSVSGTTYNWTNNTTSIGLAASGTGNIPSFAAANTTTAPVIATVAVTPTANSCAGAPDNFTITVNPTPAINTVADQSICNGDNTTTVNFSSAVSGTTYVWTNNRTSIGLAASGTGNIASFTGLNTTAATVTATITVVPTANSCTGPSEVFTIAVKPTPTVNTVLNQTRCNGATTNAITFGGSVTGTTYNWTNDNTTIGLGANGSGDISSFTATNTTNAPVTANITVTPTANGCVGTSKTFTITVNPTPTVDAIADQALCNGALTTAVNFTSPVNGATYTWTNNNTAINLASSGSGNINAFTARNTTNAPIMGTITVTPRANNCTGTTGSFDITVNPTPKVDAIASQVVCNGGMTDPINFGAAVAGSTFAWTNTTTSIGLAANGTGDIAAFTAANTTTVPVTATITVTPTANNCTGTPRSFTIRVNPTTTANAVSNLAFCHGTTTGDISLSSPVSGTTYAWSNDDTSIGLAASGTGNIRSFRTRNTTNAPVTATITITPTANGCVGTASNFTITVNPIPTINTVADQIVCNGANTTAVSFGSPVSGTTYAWSNNNASIGLAASGNGNISTFAAINNSLAPVTATIAVTPTANGCTGPNEIFTVRVNPTPTLNTLTSLTRCNGTATGNITFGGGVSGTTFAWTNNTTSIGLAANGNGNIGSFLAMNNGNTPVTATITVTPTANGCAGPSGNFTITVNPTPTVNLVADQAVCNGAATTLVSLSGSVTGATYSWTNNRTAIGLAASGTGDIPSFAATNNGTTPLVATITVTPSANGCNGATETFTITVNPTPTVANINSQERCNGAATNAINFSGGVSGTIYTWTNNNTTIGLAANGTGNISSFTATNSGVTPVTSTIVVTPTANGCTGSTKNFTITVNPTPTVDMTGDQTLCRGTMTTPINFNGTVAGTTFSWVNDTRSIGLASSGSGNIASFTANNSTASAVTATITVTPIANNCAGTPDVFTITVTPTPTVVAVTNQVVCNGSSTTAVNFSGAVTGTTFVWTNNKTSIGLAANGTGDIGSFTAINTADTPIIATITVTPSANGCTGNPRSFTIRVNPTPIVTALPDIARCNGTATSVIFSSQVSGTKYTWTNSDTSIGLAASGSRNISFRAKNVTTVPVTATIVVTPEANNCVGPTEQFTITVNPTPTIDTTWNQMLCNNSKTDSIWFRGPVSGTTFAWTNNRPAIGLAAAGSGDIAPFTVINTGTAPTTATIKVTPSANGCIGIDSTIRITINPTPTVTPISDKVFCNQDSVKTIPVKSTVTVATFTWLNNDASIGVAGSGTGDIPAFIATNNGFEPVTGTIIVTPFANGCVGPNHTFTIRVNPTPTLSSPQTLPNICAGSEINYTPTSQTTGTSFKWNRPAINGILPGIGKDSGVVSERLRNNTLDKIEVSYVYTLAANGCSNQQTVKLFVEPRPEVARIATKSLKEVCGNTFFQNFSADTVAPPGISFTWIGANAIVHATGKDKKNSLVSFFQPGEAKVYLYGSVNGFVCESIDSVVVNVKESTSQNPRVIYHNKRFVCMDNTLETYKWGYDEAGSLDSVMMEKQINQDYFEPSPDFSNRYYFVITTKDGCSQKSYYNAPTAIKEQKPLEGTTAKVYPNPATDLVTIEIANRQLTKVSTGILDLSGRLLRQEQMMDGKVTINVADLPAGVYTVVCHSNGTRIAVTKFIKN